ncbi:beta strand repeat-containing protein [Loigolactobacillus iwatensis]|uniref:beta strand repeat-containing protein n=1 Tax=Loigolactobacillus iwatensis TaxID=1267156 RepID=UPI000F7DD087|nr:MBG domain-containing protein [Loigolactobacillus iwatensis]
MQVAVDATAAAVGKIDLTQANTIATDSTGNKITATNTIGAQLALATENLPVNYYLVGTTTKLAASTTLTGDYSTAYTATAADIANYTLVGAATQKGTFAPNGVVNFYYQLNTTGNVPGDTKVYANTPVFTTAPILTLTAADGTTTTYQLQTGDYIFTQPGQSKVTPITVGTYTLALTAQGLKHLAAAEPTLNLKNATALETNAATDTITPAKASLTADSASYVYDGQAHQLTITPTGLLNGDTLTYSVTGNSRTNAGSNAVILTLAENNTTNSNYTVTLQNGTLTVTPLALTTPANPNNPSAPVNPTNPSDNPQLATSLVVQGATKVYDGAASTDPTTYTVLAPSADKDFVVPQLTASDFDLSGITSQNVGNYTVKLSAAGITKLQNANPNYDFTATDVQSGLFTITPAKATLTADSTSYVYDGQAHSLAITPTGLLNGDTLTYSVTGNSRTNVGSNAVTLALTANNAINSNYIVTLKNGTLTVTPLALTTPANPNDPNAPVNPTNPSDNPQLATSLVIQGSTKVYDGTSSTDPTTYTVLAPSADKDFVVPQLTASDFDLSGITSQSVGSYSVKLSAAGVTKLQNANPNYDFTATDVQSGLFTITPAKASLTADSASYVYDGQAHSLAVTPTGLLNGDTLTYSVTGNSRTNAGSNIVTLTLAENNTINSNYTVTLQNGTLTVAPAKATLTADSASYVYDGQAHSLAVTPTGLLNGDTLTYSVTGNSRTNAGSNAVTLTLAKNNTTNNNYTVTLKNGTLTVTPVALTTPTNPNDPSAPVNPTNPSDNSQLATNLVVQGATKVYDGTASTDPTTYTVLAPSADKDFVVPQLTANDFDLSGITSQNVGSYTVKLSTAGITKLQNANPNYNFTAADVQGGLFTITQAKATLTADSASYVYDGQAHQLTITPTGLLNGDTLTYSVTGNSRTNVGSNTVTLTLMANNAMNSNYTVTLQNGTLTIAPAKTTTGDNNTGTTTGNNVGTDTDGNTDTTTGNNTTGNDVGTVTGNNATGNNVGTVTGNNATGNNVGTITGNNATGSNVDTVTGNNITSENTAGTTTGNNIDTVTNNNTTGTINLAQKKTGNTTLTREKPTKKTNTTVAGSALSKLPQTGEATGERTLLATIGVMLLTSILGVFDQKRKHEKE